METYNEKHIRLSAEIAEKREAAFQRYDEKRQNIHAEKEIEGNKYDEEKKRLQAELDEVIERKNQLKFAGYSDLSEQIMVEKARIREIHIRQSELKINFMNKVREFARRQNDILQEYHVEKMLISREKTERQLQIEKEERERKEMLSSQNEEKEN